MIGGGSARVYAIDLGSTNTMQLPFWGNGANWDHIEYYETIQAGRRRFPRTVQSADINGDKQDELLARGPNGILTNYFDSDTGQWMVLPSSNTPALTDQDGWNMPEYFQTIQTADIDGDGRAELIARGPTGILVWKYDSDQKKWNSLAPGPNWGDYNASDGTLWNQPQYYSTIQCADIDGDGHAELIGRSRYGIQVWKYDTIGNNWYSMLPGPDWSDTQGWHHAHFYSTIQCADVDGDGQAELIGRSSTGILVWKYDTVKKQWGALPGSPPPWGDTNAADFTPWNQPQYYSTIQCADIDGDGYAEILGRNKNGIEVWKYDTRNEVRDWVRLNGIAPRWSDTNAPDGTSWNQPQYYTTIQCADIDGDGHEELLARDQYGIVVWKYDTRNDVQDWYQVPHGDVWPAWGDANLGWFLSQYYGTIQTARVKGSAKNPNNPQNPYHSVRNPDNLMAALIGRNSQNVETWRFDANTREWLRPSAPLPTFPGDQATAYQYLSNFLSSTTGTTGIRGQYNNADSQTVSDWLDSLKGALPNPITPPSGIPSDQWQIVRDQIILELTYIQLVNGWYIGKISDFINTVYLSKSFTLPVVAEKLEYSDSSSVVLNILSLVFGSAASILGFPELEAGNAASISGILSYAFSAAGEFAPGSDPVQSTISDFQDKLAAGFNNAIEASANNALAITGGIVSKDGQDVYIPGDWGLISAIGQQIGDGRWDWTSTTTADMTIAAQRGYSISVFQAIIPQRYWEIAYNSGSRDLPDNYPQKFLYYPPGETHPRWLFLGQFAPPISETPLTFLFGNSKDNPPADGDLPPLEVPLADVFEHRNQWPTLPIDDTYDPWGPPIESRPPAAEDLQILDLTLSRHPGTGEVVAAFTLVNHGLNNAANVLLTQAQLKNSAALSGGPPRPVLLAARQSRQMRVHFPNNVGAAGSTVVLRLSGQHLKGTFGSSFRVKLP